MKYLVFPFLVLFALACQSQQPSTAKNETIRFSATQADSIKLQEILTHFQHDKNLPTGELIVKIGCYWKGTPYVAHTLEADQEQLTINLREMDCTTFDESCLAMARTIKSGGKDMADYAQQLKQIRYRKGELTDYTSRLHYFSDWLYDNAQMDLISPLDSSFQQRFEKTINFMSSHPASYKSLTNNPAFVKQIADLEQELSNRQIYWLPKSELAKNEDKLQDGDIVALTSSVAGLDIAHVGFAIWVNGRIHLLHASSALGEVVVSEQPLADYLANKKSFTGIMLARPR